MIKALRAGKVGGRWGGGGGTVLVTKEPHPPPQGPFLSTPERSLKVKCTYRKIPVISPGLIQLRKGFWVSGGAYIRGAYKRNKKMFRNEPSKYIFELKSQNKATLTLFSTVIQQRGAYIRGEGGGLYL